MCYAAVGVIEKTSIKFVTIRDPDMNSPDNPDLVRSQQNSILRHE